MSKAGNNSPAGGWDSELAKKVVAECIEKKRGEAEDGSGTGYSRSLVEIYAEGAGKLGVGVRDLARRVVSQESSSINGAVAETKLQMVSKPLITPSHVDTSSLNTLLQTASAIATPSSSTTTAQSAGLGSGVTSSERIKEVQGDIDTLINDNARIITSIRANIIKASVQPNYALMSTFVSNCRDVLGKLGKLDGVSAPPFPLPIDLVMEEDLEIKKVNVGDDEGSDAVESNK